MTDLDRSELTRWVAEKCLNWKRTEWVAGGYDHPDWYWMTPEFRTVGMGFDPCTKIENAFMLVDRMRELGWQFCLGEGDECWEAGFARDMQEFEGDALTPALAITQACRAALEGAKP